MGLINLNALRKALANIGGAPHPVQVNSPEVIRKIQNAKFGVLAQGNNRQRVIQQLNNAQRQAQPSVRKGLGNLGEAFNATNAQAGRFAVQTVSRPAMEIGQSIRQRVTHRPASYTPGSAQEKQLFGDTRIDSLQKKVGDQYKRQSTSKNQALRLASRPLAAGEVLGSLLQDVPVVGLGAKAGIKGVQRVAPKAIPAAKAGVKVLEKAKYGAELRNTSRRAVKAEQKQLANQQKALQNKIKALPIGSHKSQLAQEQYQRKLDVVSGRRQQLKASGKQSLVQQAKDKLLTTQPGLSMKPVGGNRPNDALQTAIEQAHNSGNKQLEAQLVAKLPDQGMNPNATMSAERRAELMAKMKPVTEPAKLPEYGTKRVSKLDKAFRDTQSIIGRSGEHGQRLSGMLDSARDTKELYTAQLEKALPTVRSLKGKDFENFVEATQGKIQAANPRVSQAVKEWQATHPGIRDRAVTAGLDVGDLGPTYYPHFIDYDKVFKNKNTYNTAINHLVESGQAQTPEEAIKLLNYAKDVSRNRSFGNLEAQRVADLPMYDKTPNSLVSYLSGSAKRIAHTETFGAKDEKALELITKAGQQGHDAQAMKEAYDVAVGAKRYGESASDFSNKARAFQSTTRLGLGAITNSSQNVNTGIVTGHLRTLGAMAKQLSPKTREFVGDTGVIADAVLTDIKTQAGFTGKVLSKITAPGFSKVEKFNRSVAATAGRDYALRLAQRGDEATLRKLGVTGPINGKTLSESQQIIAARRIVEKTQFKVDPQDLPGWADSPGGKLVAQFRTFSYNQSKFFSNEILKPAVKGNVMPLGRLLAALPLGYGLYETKRVINGRPEEENPTKRGMAAFQNVGGAGLAFDIYQSLNPVNSQYLPSDRRISMGVSTIGGPTAGLATQAIGAVNDLIQRKNTPADASRLDGKVALGNNGETYTDATQAARFGLNQIPVIGAPIRNRVLPYKTQSQADTGKTAAGGSNGATQTPELRAFLKLKPADQKALAATDPNARALYDQQIAVKKGMNPKKLRPEGLEPEAAKVLDRYDHLLPSAKDKVFNRTKYAEYEYETAKYLEDKAAGNLSQVDDIRRQSKLAKLEIGANFDKSTRDTYGLSKAQTYEYISHDKNGKKIADQLLAYGDALEAAGLGDNKYRDSKGNVAFAPKTKGGTASRSGKLPSLAIAKAKTFSVRVASPKSAQRKTYKLLASGNKPTKKIRLKAG